MFKIKIFFNDFELYLNECIEKFHLLFYFMFSVSEKNIENTDIEF